MLDFNRIIRGQNNVEIVNKELVTLEDRNIDNIVINCYSNLYQTKLAAYSIIYSDVSTEFACEFKTRIDKLRSKFKNKTELEKADITTILGRNGTAESINVNNLHNNFKILKLKYIVDPLDVITDRFKLNAINNTISRFEKETKDYQHINKDTLEYLYNIRAEIEEAVSKGQIEVDNSQDEIVNEDLFVKEQIVLLPDYQGDGKYTIDGIKYYGVFNNCHTGILTQAGSYGVKVFSNKQIVTVYLMLSDDVMYVQYFSDKLNLFHVLTKKSALTTDMWEVFPKTNDPEVKRIFENTYKHAQLLELQHPDLINYQIRGDLPNQTKRNNGQVTYGNENYGRIILDRVLEYIRIKDLPRVEKESYFEFLGKLEEELYAEINNRRGSSKKSNPIDAKKRINLPPMSVLKVIKKGAGEKENNILFSSTSVEPNPFDIFYIVAFMKTSLHTNTRRNKGDGSKTKMSEKFIKYKDSKYLGEFCPKSENNIGRSTTLKVSIASENIKKRKTLS